jgi:hypothetical protein
VDGQGYAVNVMDWITVVGLTIVAVEYVTWAIWGMFLR